MRPAYAQLARRGGGRPRSAIVLGRKHCAGCGRWRPVCDFAPSKGGLRARCRVCQAAYNRSLRQGMTRQQRERVNEYHRFWSEAKRRAQGIAPRTFRHRRSVIDKVEFVGLPAAPLVSVIERVGVTDLELSAVAGVPPRSIYRLRVGGSRHVRLDVADRLTLAIGIPLAVVYGDTPVVSLRTREPQATA